VLVQRVLMPASGRESWTLLGEDGEVVEPAERYLAYLAAVERLRDQLEAVVRVPAAHHDELG
jgi:integrase/recombinase XerD